MSLPDYRWTAPPPLCPHGRADMNCAVCPYWTIEAWPVYEEPPDLDPAADPGRLSDLIARPSLPTPARWRPPARPYPSIDPQR